MEIKITHIDTACVLLQIEGFTILTDPTLDKAGDWYHHGFGAISRKVNSPALTPDLLPPIDLVLLSHHQHKDNLDIAGTKLLKEVKQGISTRAASRKYSHLTGLENWESVCIETPHLANLKITATPAQHRPWWLPEFFSGKVIGFVLEIESLTGERKVIYLSGDTVFFKGIQEVAKRFPKIDIALLNAGGVQFRYLTGCGKYTMDALDFVKSVKVLKPACVIPIHYEGWTHFKQSVKDLENQLTTLPVVKWLTKGKEETFK